MLSLTRYLMIRREMLPRIEGMRLYFINNQTLGFFSALAASSNSPFSARAIPRNLKTTSRFVARMCWNGRLGKYD